MSYCGYKPLLWPDPMPAACCQHKLAQWYFQSLFLCFLKKAQSGHFFPSCFYLPHRSFPLSSFVFRGSLCTPVYESLHLYVFIVFFLLFFIFLIVCIILFKFVCFYLILSFSFSQMSVDFLIKERKKGSGFGVGGEVWSIGRSSGMGKHNQNILH